MAVKEKVVIRLSADQRQTLESVVHKGTHAAAAIRRAHILLKADADGPDGWSDPRIAQAYGVERNTVRRVRQQFAAEGLESTLHRKPPTGRQYRKLDGKQEAQLVALTCSQAPQGEARWTMVLLADKLVEMKVVKSIDAATVWRTLKKTNSSPGSSSSGSSRPRIARHS